MIETVLAAFVATLGLGIGLGVGIGWAFRHWSRDAVILRARRREARRRQRADARRADERAHAARRGVSP